MIPNPYFIDLDVQAIWDAFEQAECDEYQVDPRRASLAAALREASQHIADISIPEEERQSSDPYVAENVIEGAARSAAYLKAIADKLHPSPVPTYKGKMAISLTKEELIEALAEQAAVIKRLSRVVNKALNPPTKPLPGSGLSPFPPEHDNWDPVKPGN